MMDETKSNNSNNKLIIACVVVFIAIIMTVVGIIALLNNLKSHSNKQNTYGNGLSDEDENEEAILEFNKALRTDKKSQEVKQQDAADKTRWIDCYLEYLNRGIISTDEDTTFTVDQFEETTFLNINDDEIPEILLSSESYGPDGFEVILTTDGNKVSSYTFFGYVGKSYIPNGNVIRGGNGNGAMGWNTDTVVSIKNGEWKEVFEGSFDLHYDEEKQDWLEDNFTINNNHVSREQYYDRLNSIIPNEKTKYTNDTDVDKYTVDELITDLQKKIDEKERNQEKKDNNDFTGDIGYSGKTNFISDYIKSEERLWFYVPMGMDKSNGVTAIYLTRPDGTLRYSTKLYYEYGSFGSLGELSKMKDEDIISLMDSGIKDAPAFYFGDYSSGEARDYFKEYIKDNNLRYWFSLSTDATGNNVESESFVFQSYPVPDDSSTPFNYNDYFYVYERSFGFYDPGYESAPPEMNEVNDGDVIGYYTPVVDFEFSEIRFSKIYQNDYLVLQEKGTDGVLISRNNSGDNPNITMDPIDRKGIPVDRSLPDNYNNETIYSETYNKG